MLPFHLIIISMASGGRERRELNKFSLKVAGILNNFFSLLVTQPWECGGGEGGKREDEALKTGPVRSRRAPCSHAKGSGFYLVSR